MLFTPPRQPRQRGGHSASGSYMSCDFLPLTPELLSLCCWTWISSQQNSTSPALGNLWWILTLRIRYSKITSISSPYETPITSYGTEKRYKEWHKIVQRGFPHTYSIMHLTPSQSLPPTIIWTSNFNRTDVQHSTSWAFAPVWMWDESWAYAMPSGRLSSSPWSSSPLWAAC